MFTSTHMCMRQISLKPSICTRWKSSNLGLCRPVPALQFCCRFNTRKVALMATRAAASSSPSPSEAEAEDLAAAEEAGAEGHAEPSSTRSGVAAALADAEQAIKDGSFDIDILEKLMPEAVKEVEDLLARAEKAESSQAQAEEQIKASQERYLRLNADFENFRKRSGAEKEQLGDRQRVEVIKALVPLVDSFEAAQNSIKAETENEIKINAAYQGLYKQMVETFKSLGVEAVPGVGAVFDPEFHDAIMREPNDDIPDGTILQEFRRGFRLGKALIRPAMVKVSYAEEPTPTGTNGGGGAAQDIPVQVETKEA